jgi:hypothetical protein
MLRLLFTALLILVATGSTAAEFGGRLLGVVLTLKPHQATAFTVSPDRRTVYAVTWAHDPNTGAPDQPKATTLHVIGVSDPTGPRPLAEIPLGDFWAMDVVARGTRLFVLALAQPPDRSKSVVIVDLRDQRAPVVMSRVQVGVKPTDELNVGEDGSCFALGSYATSEEFGSYDLDRDGKAEPGQCAGVKQATELGGTELVLDRRGPDSLVSRSDDLFIRTTTGAKTAEHDVYAPGVLSGAAKFLAMSEIFVALARDPTAPGSPERLVALNGGVLPFDAGRVRQAHAALLHEYEQLRAGEGKYEDEESRAYKRLRAATYKKLFGHAEEVVDAASFDSLASRLGDAGAREAFANIPHEMSQSEVVEILNDWGYWQSRGEKPAEAIPILQRVVELAPTRAVAWRNLGDAARASLSGAIADPERKRLTQLAIDAYGRYRKLTGHYQPDMKDFIEFNALNAPQDDVCGFVAAYYSRGRHQEITGVANPVDVDGSGKKVNLEASILYAGKPDQQPYVKVTGEDGEERESARAFGFGEGSPNEGEGDRIDLIPFGGAVYALTEEEEVSEKEVKDQKGGLVGLYNWSGRRVCHFTAHSTASVRQSADDAVCRHLLAGRLTTVAPTTRLSEPDSEGITSITEIDLSGSGRADRVGSFVRSTQGNRACEYTGVELVDVPESDARNSALGAADELLDDHPCDRDESLVRDHGRPYVEIDSRLLRHNEIASRTLLRITASGFETVCRIVERPTYTGLKN